MLTCAAPAKVNLFLHITGKRPDGYHLLESLVSFSSVHDTVSVQEADTITLEITGRFAPLLQHDVHKNIIVKAARLLAEKAGILKGAAILLEKELPVAAGIGGGSSDAAAVLKLLSQLWELSLTKEEMQQIALTLGADVPMCYSGKPAFISGIGENITVIPSMPILPALLVNPLQSVSTPEVFKAGVQQFSPSSPITTIPQEHGEFIRFLRTTHNDLEAPAITLLPLITQQLRIIQSQPGCLLSRMSGSGATCFGLFSTMEEAGTAAQIISSNHPEWWVKATLLGA
jgi:4-diphosphocytidyl-2-C-methyl-D-erythritol kinase